MTDAPVQPDKPWAATGKSSLSLVGRTFDGPAQAFEALTKDTEVLALQCGGTLFLTMFFTMPIAWKGTLAQYAGRLHRLNDAKREVIIYDYADMRVPVLARMAAKRQVGYQAIGYQILDARDLFSDPALRRTNPHKIRADR